jgi:hypothetical protein
MDAISGAHRRRRAMRVMVMAMVDMKQHVIHRVREPGTAVKPVFWMPAIWILHATWNAAN